MLCPVSSTCSTVIYLCLAGPLLTYDDQDLSWAHSFGGSDAFSTRARKSRGSDAFSTRARKSLSWGKPFVVTGFRTLAVLLFLSCLVKTPKPHISLIKSLNSERRSPLSSELVVNNTTRNCKVSVIIFVYLNSIYPSKSHQNTLQHRKPANSL